MASNGIIKLESWLRLAAYWVTMAALGWTVGYLCWHRTEKGAEFFNKVRDKNFDAFNLEARNGTMILHLISPLIFAASLAFLFLTREPLPTWRISWLQYICRTACGFKNGYPWKNQFLVGEVNFNYVAAFLVLVPSLGYFCATLKTRVIHQGLDKDQIMGRVSVSLGFAALVSLAMFLIPVARHSVLVVAMGWSPIQALRIHIWAGYACFWFSLIHGIMQAVLWFRHTDEEGSVWRQIFPKKECWAWDYVGETREIQRMCSHQFFNFTGIVAGLLFIGLVVSSLNYVRRKWYRIFYTLHVILGPALLLCMVWHYSSAIFYLAPGLIYYIASTSPVVIQALASRFRGGHEIIGVEKVCHGVCEVAISVSHTASAVIDSESCQYVKILCPNISLIWHPLTVYKNPRDESSFRVMMRTDGPWTQKLSEALITKKIPIVILDGFYGGRNLVEQAMLHDHITIVAGGVTITPFLSLIPNLFRHLSQVGEPVLLKSVVLHWACRENELVDYVERHYLTAFSKLAQEIPYLKYEVHMYHTGAESRVTKNVVLMSSDDECFSDEVLVDEEAKIVKEPRLIRRNSSTSEAFVDDDDIDQTEKSDRTSTTSDIVQKTAPVKSFALELPRLFSGRSTSVWWNVPGFLVFAGMLWFGTYLLYRWQMHRTARDGEDRKFSTVYSRLWSSVIYLLASILVYSVMEAAVLLLHNVWPEPKPTEYAPKTLKDSSSADGPTLARMVGDTFTYSEVKGRPTVEQIFASSRNAVQPGIFVCAPVMLCDAVKKEARRENSPFLLKTRYCVYDEPFEM